MATVSSNYKTDLSLCRIKHEGNYSYLTMPNGTLIPCQVFCRVTQVLNERPYAIVKVFVNLDDTVDDTINKEDHG